jgi:lipopolysaccharide/colanic/teichoic acid biosynthesis glycosyltransferase
VKGPFHIYKRRGKRIFDLALSIIALVALLPLLAMLALISRLNLGPPILFKQERIGLQGQSFHIIKFRTMTISSDVQKRPLPDEQRLRRWGRFLRSTSLDELPELVNVLKGDMSLVGPRPLFSKYLERYTPKQMRRHEVTPGITGWAQVNGRNALTWEQKFELDVWYVDHQSLLFDLKIIALTILKVLNREGIREPGQATAQEFMGNVKNNL